MGGFMTFEQETLWLAGLLEGEGHFNCHCSATIKLGMTDRDVVERAAKIMGTRVNWYKNSRPARKQLYECSVHGGRAAEVCKRILPFMGLRRKTRIEELLVKDATKLSHKEIGRLGLKAAMRAGYFTHEFRVAMGRKGRKKQLEIVKTGTEG